MSEPASHSRCLLGQRLQKSDGRSPAAWTKAFFTRLGRVTTSHWKYKMMAEREGFSSPHVAFQQ
jgi:hypothetical protein